MAAAADDKEKKKNQKESGTDDASTPNFNLGTLPIGAITPPPPWNGWVFSYAYPKSFPIDIQKLTDRVINYIDEDSIECRVMRAICDDENAVPWVKLSINVLGRSDRTVNMGDLWIAEELERCWEVPKYPWETNVVLQFTPDSVLLQGIEIWGGHNFLPDEKLKDFLDQLVSTFVIKSLSEQYGSVDEPDCMSVALDPIIMKGGQKLP